jgi:hypothetical protein
LDQPLAVLEELRPSHPPNVGSAGDPLVRTRRANV